MKLNKIFMAFAAVAMVGCSSEDLNDFSANQAIDESGLVQLDPNFVIGGFGEDDATTRTHWGVNGDGSVYNTFLPIFNLNASAGENLGTVDGLEKDAVGLCWLGQTPGGTDVYTNYMFYHFGWFKKDDTEKKPVFDCDKLTNGVMYNEITLASDVTAAPIEATAGDFTLPTTPIDKSGWTIDYNSGIYKTDNKAIFGGKYVVYYPFNEKFQNIGTIPAVAETMFDPAPRTVDDPALAKATFRYSSPVDIDGGSQASGFTLKNLSTLVQLRLNSKDNLSAIQVDQIVLYSAKEQLLKEVHLAADQIVAGKERADLYVSGESKGTKTIVANATPFNLATKNNYKNVFITVLPTTVEDLVVLVHNSTEGTWAEIPFNNADLKTKKAKILDVNLYTSSFKAKYIAVDEASLLKARDEARAAGGGTIKVIGDITLKAASTYDFYFDPSDTKITYEEGSIIVPEDVELNAGTKIKSDVRVLGKSCCSGAIGGRLNIYGGTLGNVTMEPAEATVTALNYDDYNPAVTYIGAATIEAGKTFDAQAGNVNVNAAVAHKANINIAEGVTLTVNNPDGDLNFMGSKVVNNGTIEVKKDAKFDITDKDGNASAEDGKNMTNNGLFIHNVDAQVGTAVQLMTQNGVYRCRVNDQIKLDDAYQKWTACSVIEMVNAGATTYNLGVAEKNINYQHNGKFIDIEVNSGGLTTFNNPVVSSGNGDNKNIQVGKLTVMQGGLYVPFVTGEGKRELTVNGDMTVSVTSSLFSSAKITVKENLIVDNNAELKYAGKKQNEGGLAVVKDIKVSGATTKFNAGETSVDALNITCANFTLADGATAVFGNRTEGDTKNLTVSGTITNPDGCTFKIVAANQEAGSVLATITCTKLIVGGEFPGGKPQVVAK